MKTISRYYLDYSQDSTLTIPSGAKILEINAEESGAGGNFSFLVWAEVDKSNPEVDLDFRILTEDEEFRVGEPTSLTYVDTVILEVGKYKVKGYHLYLK